MQKEGAENAPPLKRNLENYAPEADLLQSVNKPLSGNEKLCPVRHVKSREVFAHLPKLEKSLELENDLLSPTKDQFLRAKAELLVVLVAWREQREGSSTNPRGLSRME